MVDRRDGGEEVRRQRKVARDVIESTDQRLGRLNWLFPRFDDDDAALSSLLSHHGGNSRVCIRLRFDFFFFFLYYLFFFSLLNRSFAHTHTRERETETKMRPERQIWNLASRLLIFTLLPPAPLILNGPQLRPIYQLYLLGFYNYSVLQLEIFFFTKCIIDA